MSRLKNSLLFKMSALCCLLGISNLAATAELSLISHHTGQPSSVIYLEDITLPELMLTQQALRDDFVSAVSAHAKGNAYMEGNQLRVNIPPPEITALTLYIERELPLVWRLYLEPHEYIQDVRLEASWHPLPPRSRTHEMPTPDIVLTEPWRVSTSESGEVWEGHAAIRLPTDALHHAASISGELRIELIQ
jgi:hypothetical protein